MSEFLSRSAERDIVGRLNHLEVVIFTTCINVTNSEGHSDSGSYVGSLCQHLIDKKFPGEHAQVLAEWAVFMQLNIFRHHE